MQSYLVISCTFLYDVDYQIGIKLTLPRSSLLSGLVFLSSVNPFLYPTFAGQHRRLISLRCNKEPNDKINLIDLSDNTSELTQEQIDELADGAPDEFAVLMKVMSVDNIFSVSILGLAIAIIIVNNVLGVGWARNIVGLEPIEGETVTIERGLNEMRGMNED